jgi:chromosome segregation ATPase
MKRTLAALTVFTLLFAQALPAADDKVAQEAQRNRELLEIWKEHVKALTKERDDAFRELETLKARGASPVAQFGGVETAPLPNMAGQQIKDLQAENARLQEEIQKRASSGGGTNRELQMQFSALQNQFQQMKKELNEARTEKDRLIREKEKALAQAERLGGTGSDEAQSERYNDLEQRFIALQQENEGLRSRSQQPQQQAAPAEDTDRVKRLEEQIERYKRSSNQSAGLQNEIEGLREENAELKAEAARLREANKGFSAAAGDPDREKEVFMRQARELQYENDTLKAQIEKLQVVEKELANTRGYFTPMVKEMQESNDRIANENASLRSELDKTRVEAERREQEVLNARQQHTVFQKEAEAAANQIATLKSQSQSLSADVRTLKAERDDVLAQVDALKAQISQAAMEKDKWAQAASAEREKLNTTSQELLKLQEQHEQLQKAYAVLETNARSNDARTQQLTQQLAAVEKNNREIAAREAANVKAAEKYKTALTANLTDMKNLKSNFEAYLESLVASFEERQR